MSYYSRRTSSRLLFSLLIALALLGFSTSFLPVATTSILRVVSSNNELRVKQNLHTTRTLFLSNDKESEANAEVKVGSKEYYAGFIKRDLSEEEERVTGDKVLIPTLKFGGIMAVLIGLFLGGFMASNGLL